MARTMGGGTDCDIKMSRLFMSHEQFDDDDDMSLLAHDLVIPIM